jgi:hypothetical protein
MVQVCLVGGDGARSSLIRMDVELLSLKASWNAEGEVKARLNRCHRDGLPPEAVIVAGVQRMSGARMEAAEGGLGRGLDGICAHSFSISTKRDEFWELQGIMSLKVHSSLPRGLGSVMCTMWVARKRHEQT